MSLSLFARKAVVCWSLAGFCTTLLTAQTAYPPLGNEVVLPGVLPGDQAAPHIGVSATGGFLVWQDNVADGNGTGIRAVGLDSNFSPAQAPFRVNYEAKGEQEAPQVTLFSGGGAAFFWKGGPVGFQKAYARFLSPSNTWLTGDLLISSPSNNVRTTPSVAVLTNGNLVAVWAAFDQRGSRSMQDVYAQILSPAGQKIGPAFPINQFTTYNQRNPFVAALPNGGFVTAWVSEQQRREVTVTTNEFIYTGEKETVDIYARVYDANSIAMGNEFLINTNVVVCAAPMIAAAPDSGFVIAWSQGNPRDLGNQWDIYARAFSPLAVGGATERINAHVRGTQFGPRISALSNDFLVVWTSLWQDGSYEGVYGQFINRDAKPVGAEFRVNSNVVLNQNQPAVAADAFGRFVAVWKTSCVESRLSEEICAQVYAQPGFVPLAVTTNYSGPVFVGPVTGGGGSSNVVVALPSLPFPVTPSEGTPPADGFARAKGAYVGLLYNKFGVTAFDSGYVTAIAADTGRYSVNLRVGLKTYAFAGRFDGEGNATREIPRAGKAPIRITLHLDLLGTDQLRGTFNDGQSECEFLADRLVYSAANPCPLAGRYNLVIPAPSSDEASPEGYGYGTLLVYKNGKTLFSGKLADGTVITQNSAVSKNGIWPLFGAPYMKRGVVLGWVQLEPTNAQGDIIWIKPATVTKYYPSGFAGTATLSGTPYTKPDLGKRVLDFADGTCSVSISSSTLGGSVTTSMTIDLNNAVTVSSDSGVRFTVSPLNGSFQGSFIDPESAKRVSFTGKLLQKENYGAGFFLLNNASGQVLLTSPQ